MAKINISLSREILEKIDRLSREEKMTRSELLRNAFKIYSEFLEEKKRERQKQNSIEKAVRLQDEIRNALGKLDLVEDLRKWRDRRK